MESAALGQVWQIPDLSECRPPRCQPLAVPTSAMPTSSDANLHGAILHGVILSTANLRTADLSRVLTSAVPTSAMPTSAVPTSAVPTSEKLSVGGQSSPMSLIYPRRSGLRFDRSTQDRARSASTRSFSREGRSRKHSSAGVACPMLSSVQQRAHWSVRWSLSSSTHASSATARRTRISRSACTRRCETRDCGSGSQPEDIQGGKKPHEQIDEAIRLYDKLLLVLSPESMNSEWVKTEIRKARKAEIKEEATEAVSDPTR